MLARQNLRAIPLLTLPLLLGASADAPTQEKAPFSLAYPLRCTMGAECFIQQYADRDPSPAVRDYRCGARSYDGHDGTDFRVATIAAQKRGVDVLAAADGIVLAARADEEDVLKTAESRDSVKGKECGNGLLIAHDDGWQTQYCHMARGSIVLREGQSVVKGAVLGKVGLSGDTQFPHLHLSVRHYGQKIDPFRPDPKSTSCGPSTRSLWSASDAPSLAYQPTEIINSGFAAGALTMADIDEERATAPTPESAAFVVYQRAIGLRTGDMLHMLVEGPDGKAYIAHEQPLDRAKAQFFVFAGRKRPEGGWKKGTYKARFWVEHEGQIVAERRATLTL